MKKEKKENNAIEVHLIPSGQRENAYELEIATIVQVPGYSRNILYMSTEYVRFDPPIKALLYMSVSNIPRV